MNYIILTAVLRQKVINLSLMIFASTLLHASVNIVRLSAHVSSLFGFFLLDNNSQLLQCVLVSGFKAL